MRNENTEIIDEFEKEFNKIESYLKRYLNVDKYVRFYDLINQAKDKNYVIRNKEHVLKYLGDLRNTVIHQKGLENYAIPTKNAISELKEINKKLTKPKKVYDLIKNKVTIINVNDLLIEVLNEIKKFDYSQFPVYDEHGYIGLLTNNSISRWLSKNIDSDSSLVVDLKAIGVNEVLKYNESEDDVIFISREIDIYTFIEKYLNSRTKIKIFLITEGGKKDNKPMSIVTPYDFERLIENM